MARILRNTPQRPPWKRLRQTPTMSDSFDQAPDPLRRALLRHGWLAGTAGLLGSGLLSACGDRAATGAVATSAAASAATSAGSGKNPRRGDAPSQQRGGPLRGHRVRPSRQPGRAQAGGQRRLPRLGGLRQALGGGPRRSAHTRAGRIRRGQRRRHRVDHPPQNPGGVPPRQDHRRGRRHLLAAPSDGPRAGVALRGLPVLAAARRRAQARRAHRAHPLAKGQGLVALAECWMSWGGIVPVDYHPVTNVVGAGPYRLKSFTPGSAPSSRASSTTSSPTSPGSTRSTSTTSPIRPRGCRRCRPVRSTSPRASRPSSSASWRAPPASASSPRRPTPGSRWT
ncbi:hypothetical protein Ddc_20088 [Ditylenchus destructor]|nr:hypothetical protein Ddc_20088 [Ditylenchus destructor]